MNRGTAPIGIQGEKQVAQWVRRMFDSVAPRYDLLNHLLSMNTDKYWRWRAVRRVEEVLRKPNSRVLDLCCGSGDLLIALQEKASSVVQGADFSHEMLRKARNKIAGRRLQCPLIEADALQLPCPDQAYDLVAAAFGFRNLAHYGKGLTEMLRILKPGGTIAILEFSTPPNPAFRALYNLYCRRLMPRIGAAISGSPIAYAYLQDSVRKFPGAAELAGEMERAGFRNVRFHRMTFGVVALHLGERG